MKLSMKTDYALRAMFTLVERYGQGPVSIRELAEVNDVPKRFLEHIMIELKREKWVHSTPGRDGGYELSREPAQITMGQIVRHFDGIMAPISCVSISGYRSCSQEHTCRFRRVLLDIRNYTAELMDRATLADVYAGKPVTRDEVFSEKLIAGAGI